MPQDTKYCHECGAEINAKAEMCPECGVPQSGSGSAGPGKEEEVFAGLNQTGVIVFIILLLVCFPFCWLPWVIDDLQAS